MFDTKLVGIFQAELQEHLDALRRFVSSASDGGAAAGQEDLAEALRRAHTLKGAARAVGIAGIEVIAHRLETFIAQVRDRRIALDAAACGAISRTLDSIEDIMAAVLARGEEPDPSSAVDPLAQLAASPAARPDAGPDRAPPAPAPAAGGDLPEFVRVSAESVDELVRASSQLLRATAAGLLSATVLDDIGRHLREAAVRCSRIRAAASHPAAHGAEHALDVTEALSTIESGLRSLAAQMRTITLSQRRSAWTLHRLGSDVHHEACRVRMVPAGSVFDPFRKMVRDLTDEAGKETVFRAEGLGVLADRSVLQALKDPVMHLLRNAVAHGIEPPEERMRSGKPRAGAILLRLESAGGSLRVTVEDDGRGIDYKRIAEVAVARGFLGEDAARAAAPRDLERLIFQPGFSTVVAITPLAGRGMGLSVVAGNVLRLRGDVAVQPGAPAGTRVVLSVPLSIATIHVLLIECGGQKFALPTSAVERVLRVRPREFVVMDGRRAVRWAEGAIPVADLAAITGHAAARAVSAAGSAVPVVVLRSAGAQAGIVVDELVDEREAIVSDLGLPPEMAGMSTGGIALDDGAVAVVLSAPMLIERVAAGVPAAAPAATEHPRRDAPRTVLVVDDSITTRSLERSILEAHGYRVRLAVDGVDALNQLRGEPADIVIADLAMPRMDGFQLLTHMKKDKRLSSIPVIIVSSLEREEDQKRGLALGADAYIVKRKFDQRELLEAVRQAL